MAGGFGTTGGWLKKASRLFCLGTLGGLSDGQLLDEFVSRREGNSEAAFEELMYRHGPMVLRICQTTLRDPQDAEDAFQAAFLVLAHRAGAIRQQASVGSWLFGVSRRVAAQARLRSARRRAGEQYVAQRRPEAYPSAGEREEEQVLLEEIDRLPDRLRLVVVLCYLEGLTYDAAARRLGLSEGSIRGRLAQARDLLRRRLTRRGIGLPSVLLAAGTLAEEHARAATSASLSAPLINSTARIAMGFKAGEAASTLARGVLYSMLLGRLRSAAAVFLIVLGGSRMAWQTFAAPNALPPPPQASRKPEPPVDAPEPMYAITGRVSVEGTGEPVAGAGLRVALSFLNRSLLGDVPQSLSRDVQTGADGRFRAELPAGYASIGLVDLPPGYLRARPNDSSGDVVLSRDARVTRTDFLVRRGTIWNFEMSHDSGGPLAGAMVSFLNPKVVEDYRARSDRSGQAILTLPPEARNLTGHVSCDAEYSQSILLELEWESGFQPGSVRSIVQVTGRPGRFRLTDSSGKSAQLGVVSMAEQYRAVGFRDQGVSSALVGADAIHPVIERGKLVIRVALSETKSIRRGELTGLVVDAQGRPVAGARVGLAYVRNRGREESLSRDKRDWSTSDPQGRYHIRAVALPESEGKPSLLEVVASKAGFSQIESEPFPFEPSPDGRAREVAPLRLGPDVTLSGTVVDPQGRPVEGAWVEVSPARIINENKSVRTDQHGRFAVQGLPTGISRLWVIYGDLVAGSSVSADAPARDIVVQLHPRPKPRAAQQAAKAAQKPRSTMIGQPAPDWQVSGWSDDRPRQLTDFRGKIVFLDFWGIWCGPCVSALPVLNRLRDQFEPRGVVFLSIHTPGEDRAAIRRVLLANKASLVYAIDRDRGDKDHTGATAQAYHVRGFPSVFLIDREGNIAFCPEDPAIGPKVEALMKSAGIDLSSKQITEEQSHLLLEKLFSNELERLLKVDDSGGTSK
ncbi:MAG: sigma-70 family RNA polymerase sigma factor [Isosphaeraceae bacterium]